MARRIALPLWQHWGEGRDVILPLVERVSTRNTRTKTQSGLESTDQSVAWYGHRTTDQPAAWQRHRTTDRSEAWDGHRATDRSEAWHGHRATDRSEAWHGHRATDDGEYSCETTGAARGHTPDGSEDGPPWSPCVCEPTGRSPGGDGGATDTTDRAAPVSGTTERNGGVALDYGPGFWTTDTDHSPVHMATCHSTTTDAPQGFSTAHTYRHTTDTDHHGFSTVNRDCGTVTVAMTTDAMATDARTTVNATDTAYSSGTVHLATDHDMVTMATGYRTTDTCCGFGTVNMAKGRSTVVQQITDTDQEGEEEFNSAEMVQSADVDTPPSQEAELEDLDLGLIGIDDLEPYFDIFQDTDSIFEQLKRSCDWEADPIDPPFLSTLAEGTLDLTHISSEVAMTTARPEREAPPKKSRAERKRRRSEPPVSRPEAEGSPRGKHRRAAGCARRTGYPGEPAVTGGDTASPEIFQNGLQTPPPPSSSPTTVQLQLSPSPPASLQLLRLPDSPVYQLIPTATLSPFFGFHPNTAATPTYILVQAPLPPPRGLQDVPRSPAGGTEAPIVPSSPPGSMSDSASRGPPPPSASPLSPTTGSPSSQSKTARCVCPTLTDAVVEYIQQAKAHMKLISQEMEAGLAMSSHYVDVRLVQRQIHIRSGKNANKCLDKELVVMGDAERQQSCVGRSQIFQSSPGAKPRRSVVLLGNAGMGKTTLIKKLCLDWSEGSLPQFDFVFLLDGRALSVTAATHSLQSLLFGLSSAPPRAPADPDAVFARVREAPERVLLVLDGFEAPRDYETLLQASPEAAGEEPGRGHTPRQLYTALLQRRLLPGCSLLLAARPGSTASQVLRRADGLLELRGFSPAELSLYLGRRFPGAARRALAALEGAGFLRALCRNPGLCATACRVLLPPEGSGRSPLPDTLTGLCHRVVRRGMEEALAGRRRGASERTGNGGRTRDGGASTAGGTRGGGRRASTADDVRRTRSCTRTEEEEEEEEEEGEKERREERELLAQLSQLAWEGVKQHSSLLATDQTISARLKGLALRTGLFHSYRLRGGRCGGGAGGGSGETEGSPGECDDVTDDHILSWANPFLQSFLAGAHLSFSRSVSDRHFLVHTLPNQSGSRRRRRPQGEGLELTHRFTVSLLFLDEAELRDLVADADAVATETAAAKRALVSAHLEALGRGVLGPAQLLEACHYAHEVGGIDRNVGALLAGRLARNLPEVLSFHGVPLCSPDVFVVGKVLEAALTQDRGTSLPDPARPRVFHLGLEDTGVPLSGLRALVGLSNVTVFRACIADVIALWEELEQHGEAGLLKEAVSKFTVNPLKVTQPSQLEQLATLVGIHTRRRLTDSPVDSVLVEGVPAVSTLRHLELELGPEKAALALPKLLEALPALHNLQLLDLEGSKLGDRGAVGLAKALPSLSSLEILNLSQNSIGDRGLERLAPALGTLPSLHCLSLYSNVIGDAGAESLAAALPCMTSLTDLDVKFNKFTDVGAQCLGASLNRCPWIKSLGMWNQCIPYFVFERLQQQDPRIRSSL